MNQLSMAFDYAALAPNIRTIALTRRDAIKTLERRTAESVIEIGQHLIDVKDALPHGQFKIWLDSEFGWSYDTAINFMRVASVFGDKRKISTFQTSALYALASGNIPEEIREQFIQQAEAGEPVTHKQVQTALTEYKTATAPKQDSTSIIYCECGEQVPVESWHCDGCHAHWPMAQRFCLNCVPDAKAQMNVSNAPTPITGSVRLPDHLEDQLAINELVHAMGQALMGTSLSARRSLIALNKINPETLQSLSSEHESLQEAMNAVLDAMDQLQSHCRAAMSRPGAIRRIV